MLFPRDRSLCDWPLIAAAALMLLMASVRADPSPLIIARDSDRLVLLPETVNEANFGNLPAVNCWERQCGRSTVKLTRVGDGLLIAARLDLPGPSWLEITVVSDECGITLASHDTVTNFDTFEQVDDVDGLSVDGRVLLGTILAHIGQCGLPYADVLRAIDQPAPATPPPRLATILDQLDADSCAARCAAQRQLERDVECLRWVMDHPPVDVSPEVTARVDAATALYANR